MRKVKRIILLTMAIALLAAGCSGMTEEKSGSFQNRGNADPKDLLTVDEMIRITGISEVDYGDVDLRQFIEDFEITEDNVESLNVKLLLEEYSNTETDDVTDIFSDTAQEQTEHFTDDVTAIAFYENMNTTTECVYYDLVSEERYRASNCFLFSDLGQAEAEPYPDGELLIDKMDELGVFSWENSSSSEVMDDAQGMELAVKYEDGTIFHISATGILSEVMPDTYAEIKKLLLKSNFN
uniref:hypothetical protein n=1 Tax=Lachnoclostridium phocaeense TaxID=1871021 RepID=UPI0026DD2BA4|nr:hypothetical protein [Lachnoclostridium phocaeense]